MNLQSLKSAFKNNGCTRIYVKRLSPNDNSKNQVYLGGSFELLNIFPVKEITTVPAGNWERERAKAAIDFAWVGIDGSICPAPSAQLILYPKYPEVRLSGFLAGCANPPSELMTQRIDGRLLFLGVSNNGTVLSHVTAPNSSLTSEFDSLQLPLSYGVFYVLDLLSNQNNRSQLLVELWRIHQLDWIPSKRLDRDGNVMECNSSNCGGYTLEAELGITPNGYSAPDYLGWEVKQFNVSGFNRTGSSIITLMTPEPTNGFYVQSGVEAFIRQYGYTDRVGRQDRMNFGGIHKAGTEHKGTGLTLQVIGFDQQTGKIRNMDGRLALVDKMGNEAASWSFASMLLHWNKKHNQACYVPSMVNKNNGRAYKYGNQVILGTGTDFQFFLSELQLGNIYYDPGIKMENCSTAPSIKRRSQFRMKSAHLSHLYRQNELVNLGAEG